MYGPIRFLHNNLITVDNIVASAVRGGVISGSVKVGTGSALMYTSGTYTGTNRRSYLCQIDSISAGAEVGQATFKWRSSDTASGTWEATGVTTSATAVTLEDGIDVLWVSGTGADFAVNDQFSFWTIPSYGALNVVNFLDRGSVFLGPDATTSIDFTVNLGSAQQITVFGLGDHNLTGSATITLKANTSDSWGAPPYSQAVTLADIATLYLDETYQYWRGSISDATNPDTYIQVGLMHLGTYLEPDHQADWGSTQALNGNVNISQNPYGITHNEALSWQDSYVLNWNLLDNAGVTELRDMLKTLYPYTTGAVEGLFVHFFSDETDEIADVKIIPELSRSYDWIDLNSFTLTCEEVPLVNV